MRFTDLTYPEVAAAVADGASAELGAKLWDACTASIAATFASIARGEES